MKAKFLSLLVPITFLLAQNSFAEVKIITNKHRNIKTPVTEIAREESNQNIYDLSFVAYDKSFAEEFGLKPELVTTMDKGLRFLEVKMITEGKETNCHYNLVLDKSVEVAFPKGRNYFLKNSPEMYTKLDNINIPSDVNDPKYKTAIEKFEYNRKFFFNNLQSYSDLYANRLYVGTQDYQKDKPRAKNGASLNYYIQDRLNYKILSMKGYCSLDAGIFELPKPSVWVAKDDLGYNTMVSVSPTHFNRFLIPEKNYKTICSNCYRVSKIS